MQRSLRIIVSAALAGAAFTTAAPAMAQGRWDWRGDPRPVPLVGPGVRMLLPELRDNPRGRAFVLRNFDWNHDGFITPREANAANRAFITVAGPERRDRFDWDHPGNVVVIEERGPARWDMGAMRGYGFRQTPRGAMMRMNDDVLFATDSAVLRPGAMDRLRALADYLRSEPGVRVAIDGYTDSRGTDAHNQALSERRADAVRSAFDDLGVTRARFSVVGHGEADPVAPNTTPDGMRQNRRVEITLLGQRADRFGR